MLSSALLSLLGGMTSPMQVLLVAVGASLNKGLYHGTFFGTPVLRVKLGGGFGCMTKLERMKFLSPVLLSFMVETVTLLAYWFV